VRPHPAIGLSVRAGRSRARGDYHFSDPPLSGDAVREDGDYLSRSLTVAAGWTDSGRDRAGLMVSGLLLDQGAPGPLGPGGEASSARRNDTRYIAGLSFEHGPAGSPSVVVTGLIDRQHERFLDASGPYPADDHYQTTWAGVSGQVRFHPARGWILQAGADAHRESAAGSAMDRARGLSSGGVTGSISWTTFNAGGIEASVTPSLRLEGNSGFGPDLSPKIGLNLTREGDGMMARIHATAGSGRRNPTMNELFYSGEGGKGNPDLSGESSVSFDIGFGGTADLFGGLGWDITWYGIWMRDRIQWLPTVNPRVWSPENIGRTRSTGWEIAGDWNVLPGTAEFRCNYSIIDARRGSLNGDGSIRYDYQLTYVPLDEGSVELRLGGLGTGPRSRSLYLTIALVHTGEKYLLDDESEFLPSSDIVDGTLTVDFSLFGNALTLNYKAGNLTGKDYQVMPGYPMPRFNQRVIVSYNISI
jgi:outer membrane cobalamin receptor